MKKNTTSAAKLNVQKEVISHLGDTSSVAKDITTTTGQSSPLCMIFSTDL